MSWRDRFPGFGLRMTRWGMVFLVAMLVLALAAVNTGNNSLMAILGLALGSYAVSGAWSRQVLGAMRVVARAPSDVFAGRPAVVEIEVANLSRWLPAYGVVVRDAAGRVLLVEGTAPPRSRRRHAVEVSFDRRGRQPMGPWRLEVVLPLGFFVKSKDVVRQVEVLVYPRLLPSGLEPARAAHRHPSPGRLDGRGRQGDVTQLRGWRDGDDRRQLHWKQTARQQRPIVVDRQHHADDPVVVVLDLRVPDIRDPAVLERFELLVSSAATTVVERLSRGAAVGLVAGGVRVAPVTGVAHASRLLAVLADVEPQPAHAEGPVRVEASMRTVHLGATA